MASVPSMSVYAISLNYVIAHFRALRRSSYECSVMARSTLMQSTRVWSLSPLQSSRIECAPLRVANGLDHLKMELELVFVHPTWTRGIQKEGIRTLDPPASVAKTLTLEATIRNVKEPS